ncbi:MAG: hypothetical protein JWR10_930, partial [Rubritepida sp.]|nr:hypothetical protein [Rubritepida sp.]
IAEGVEDSDQLELVTDCACDAVQGYYFSRPLHPHSLDAWLSGKLPAAA